MPLEERARHAPKNPRRGELSASSKLTAFNVEDIRFLSAVWGLSQCELARLYEVNQSTIRDLLLKKTWKHVA